MYLYDLESKCLVAVYKLEVYPTPLPDQAEASSLSSCLQVAALYITVAKLAELNLESEQLYLSV